MRRATLSLVLFLTACNHDPPMDTPEGVAIAALRAARANDADAFVAIAANPNQGLLDETGTHPRPGSYAEVLVREGNDALRAELSAAAAGPLPTGTLNLSSSPLEGSAWDVTIRGDTGAVHVMVISTPQGLRAAHVGGGTP